MDSKKIDLGGSRDIISGLPDALCCHILSFLPTKEAASTSVLSKRWRNLLAFVPNLEFVPRVKNERSLFNYFKYAFDDAWDTSTRFMDSVDNVLALQGNAPLERFKLKCRNGHDSYRVFDWIAIALKRGVLDLDVDTSSSWECYPLPSKIFVSKTLVRLKLGVRVGGTIDVRDDVSLPKLKTLHLDSVYIVESMFAKLLSGCPALKESVLINLAWTCWKPFSVSSTTLKSLKFGLSKRFCETSEAMSFDTPNLLYLEYYDNIADKYPKVSFDSLVEASLGIRLVTHQIERIRNAEDVEAETDGKMVIGDVTNFLMGISSVKILYLSDDTLHVLNYCCETVPMFDNLVHLTIKTHEDVGWKSLPCLLKNSPILDTLIFEGLHHKCMIIRKDEDECLCKSWGEEEEHNVPTCLSSSPVKVLKILMVCDENYDIEERKHDVEVQVDQVKYFLEHMPNLEQMILNSVPSDEDVIKVSCQLQMLPKVASSKCTIQVISDSISLSFAPATKWGPLLYKNDPDFSDMDVSPVTSLSSL